MNHEIYHLRHTQMDERLALMLSPIIAAYRPHDDIPTRQQLGDPIQRATCNPFTSV